MNFRSAGWPALLAWMSWWGCAASFAAQAPGDSVAPAPTKLPAGTLLVKGAWSSASDSVTPVPEAGEIADQYYNNEYFGLRYPLPAGWTQQYEGPPPSDSGYYVLAQIVPPDLAHADRGTILITAQDLFFTPIAAENAQEFVKNAALHLAATYVVEQPPSQVTIGNRTFVRFSYESQPIGLHWYILATEVRCHVVQFVFTTRDRVLTDRLLRDFQHIVLSARPTLTSRAGESDTPVCVKAYASPANLLKKVEPAAIEHPFNPIPVRVILDTQGKVKHVHFLSAFPSDAKSITDALLQWRFKPYVLDGQAVEVETGIVFGRELQPPVAPQVTANGSRSASD